MIKAKKEQKWWEESGIVRDQQNKIKMKVITKQSSKPAGAMGQSEAQSFFHLIDPSNRRIKSSFAQPREHSKAFQLKETNEAMQKLESIAKEFLSKLQELVNTHSQADLYFCMSSLRTLNFFDEIVKMLAQVDRERMSSLAKTVETQNLQIEHYKRQISKIQEEKKPSEPFPVLYHGIGEASSLGQALFYKAKILTQFEFKALVDKLMLSSSPQITKLQLLKKRKKSNLQQQQENESSKGDINERVQCKRPCCIEHPQQMEDKRVNKAKTLLNTKHFKLNGDHYRTDKSVEYFNHYYRQGFRLDEVFSIEKTKLKEMEEIEITYNRKMEKKKRASMYCNLKKELQKSTTCDQTKIVNA